MDATEERQVSVAVSRRPEGPPAIDVRSLTKHYRVVQKEPGLAGAVRGLVARRYREVVAAGAPGANR